MKKSLLCILASVLAAAPVAAVADEMEDGEDVRPFVAIDQEDVVNKTDNPTANFSSLIDRIETELAGTGLYRVMSHEDAMKVNRKWDIMDTIGDEGGETGIRRYGFFLGMTISTYGLTSAQSRDALTGAGTATEMAKVELMLKIVNARTSETLKPRLIEGSAVGRLSGSSSNLREQVLQSALKQVCEKIVYELVKHTQFSVLDVEDGIVSLDVPGTLKINGKPIMPGLQFAVSKHGKPKMSKRTGKVTRSERQVAVVGVTSVGEDSCSARILSGAIPPIGDDEDSQYDAYIVKINEGATSVSPSVQPAPPNPPVESEAPGAPF